MAYIVQFTIIRSMCEVLKERKARREGGKGEKERDREMETERERLETETEREQEKL